MIFSDGSHGSSSKYSYSSTYGYSHILSSIAICFRNAQLTELAKSAYLASIDEVTGVRFGAYRNIAVMYKNHFKIDLACKYYSEYLNAGNIYHKNDYKKMSECKPLIEHRKEASKYLQLKDNNLSNIDYCLCGSKLRPDNCCMKMNLEKQSEYFSSYTNPNKYSY
jgi:hypothetical protein